VLDASVLVAALVDTGESGAWAEELIASAELVAPELALVETTNILRRLELAEEIHPLEASAAQQDLMRLDVVVFPFAPFAERVWELRNNLTSYDAWYVALAEGIGVPLATLDRSLARAAGLRCEVLLPG